MARGGECPFQPGRGVLPPYLAGRADEQSRLAARVTALGRGTSVSSDVVLYGPRGNGKTVLLGWLEQEIESRAAADVVRLAAAEVPDEAKLAEHLRPESWWERLIPGEVSLGGLVWRKKLRDSRAIRRALETRCHRRPFVLLLDEAHTLDPGVGRVLLNASQSVGAHLPFLLVLAGTPNLETHLNRMGATFWGRADHLLIGRLGASETREAFRRPFVEEGVEVTAGAVDEMVRVSQGYPYFIQLLGASVWHASARQRRGPYPITPAVVGAGRAAFERAKGIYYAGRYDELERRGLLTAGRTVAEGFRERNTLTFEDLNARVAAGLAGDPSHREIVRVRDQLRDLGYVWRGGPEPVWEPGIPSLMDYIREHVPAS